MEELDKVKVEEKAQDEAQAEKELAEKVEALAQERAIELTNSAVSERVRKLNEKHELDKQAAVAEALAKAKMSTEELKEDEVKKLADEKAEIEQKYNELLNTSQIEKTLSEHKLPQDEKLIKALLGNVDEVEDVAKSLRELLDTEIQKAVDEKLKSSDVVVKTGDTTDLTKTSTKVHRNTASRIGVK